MILLFRQDRLTHSPPIDPKSSPHVFTAGPSPQLQHGDSTQSLAGSRSESSGSPLPPLSLSQTSLLQGLANLQVGPCPSLKPTFNVSLSQEPLAGTYCTSSATSGLDTAIKSHNGLSDEEMTVSMIQENKSLRVS